MNINKLICCLGIGLLFILISCEPVRIVSAKYNGSEVIPFSCGNMRVIALTRSNTNYELLFNYVFADTIIFKDSIHTTTRKGEIITQYPYVPDNVKIKFDFKEYILFGDGIMRITGFNSPRNNIAIPDTLYVHISRFFDKNGNPILLDPIEYYIEDVVNFNPFRDKGRDYVSSKKKIDRKRGILIFDDGSYRTY